MLDPRAIKNIKSQSILVVRTQADLNRRRWINVALLSRVPEHGAMIDAVFVFIRPRITVCIEMDERNRLTVLFGMRSDQGPADEMVTT